MRSRVAGIAALLAGGCAWSAGGGFAEIETGQLTLDWKVGKGRLDSTGRWLTSNGYALSLAGGGLSATSAAVSLIAAAGGSGAASFDPAKPPAGYMLCHSGHCHRGDGALIPYADVEADLIRSAGGVATRSVATVSWDFGGLAFTPDVAAARSLASCTPSCFLPRATVAGADLALGTLSASGTVEALPGTPALAGGIRAWSLTLEDLTIKGNAVQAISRESPAAFSLDGTLSVTDKLFDDVDWSQFGPTSPIAVEASAQALAALKANFARSKWTPALKARI